MIGDKIVYVVTNINNGWDCVVGVFTDKDFVEKEYSDEEDYIISDVVLDESVLEKIKPSNNPDYIKIGQYDNYLETFLIFDSSNITSKKHKYKNNNSIESVSMIRDLWIKFCKDYDIECDFNKVVIVDFENRNTEFLIFTDEWDNSLNPNGYEPLIRGGNLKTDFELYLNTIHNVKLS